MISRRLGTNPFWNPIRSSQPTFWSGFFEQESRVAVGLSSEWIGYGIVTSSPGWRPYPR